MGSVVLNKKTLREQVVDILRERILRGGFKPGEKLKEAEIASELNVSRGPIREALRQLEEEGLIAYEAHKGCVVKTISYREMLESYLLRSTLEILAVKILDDATKNALIIDLDKLATDIGTAGKNRDLYAIQQADEAFHAKIVEAADCQRVHRMWKSLEGINAATYYTMSSKEKMPYDSLERNHRMILDAIKSGDMDNAYKIIEEHYLIVPAQLNEMDEENKME